MAKRKPFLVRGFCLAMLILGMHSSFYHTFLPHPSLIKFTMMLVAASLWFTALSVHPFPVLERWFGKTLRLRRVRYPFSVFCLFLSLCATVIYVILYRERIVQDAQVLSDAFKYACDVYYGHASGVFPLQGYHGANGSRLLFLIEVLLTMVMARLMASRHGMFWGILPVAVVLSGVMMVGKTPEMGDMALLLCGVFGLQLLAEEMQMGGGRGFRQISTGGVRKKLVNPAAILFLAIFLAGMSAAAIQTAEVCLSKESELLRFQHRLEKRVTDAGVKMVQRLQTLLGMEQPGIMTNVSPRYTGDKVMTIRMKEKPASDIYLRGYIGTYYEKGRWSNKSDHILSKYFSEDDCYGFYCLDYGSIQAEIKEINSIISDDKKGSIYSSSDNLMTKIGDSSSDEGISQYDLSDGGIYTGSDELIDETGFEMTISYAKDNRSSFGYFPYYSCLDENSMGVLRLDRDRGFRRDRSVRSFQVKDLSESRWLINDSVMKDWLLQTGHIPYYSTVAPDGSDGGDGGVDLTPITPVLTEDATIYPVEKKRKAEDLQEPVSLHSGDKLPVITKEKRYLWVDNENLARYYQYALQEYTRLPSLGLTDAKKLAKRLVYNDVVETGFQDRGIFYSAANQTISAGETIESLRTYLKSTTTYSQKLRMRSSQLDYVENFLFEEKCGYCEHYATAGVVLLRAMGIPSRYVSGYYVPVGSFRQEEDGTYVADVLDSDAHAWSEVLTLKGGWTVADMTPNGNGREDRAAGDGSSPGYPTPTPVDTGDDAFLTASSDPQKEDEPEATIEPEETETPEPVDGVNMDEEDTDTTDYTDSEDGNASSPEEGSSEAKSGILLWLPWLGGGLACILVIAWARYSQRAHRRRQLKRCRNSRETILMMNRLMEKFLASCGYREVRHMTDREYIQFLNTVYPKGKETKLAEEYYRLLEQARFAQDEGSREQVRSCSRMLSRFGRAALAGRGRMRKFYVRFVRNWRA